MPPGGSFIKVQANNPITRALPIDYFNGRSYTRGEWK